MDASVLHAQSLDRFFERDILVWLLDNNLDTLEYFRLYQYELHIGTDSARTALVTHRCMEIAWMKTALQDGFVSYDHDNCDTFDVKEEVRR